MNAVGQDFAHFLINLTFFGRKTQFSSVLLEQHKNTEANFVKNARVLEK